MDDLQRFKPNDETRAIGRALTDKLFDGALDQFFNAWESESDSPDAPLRAGSVIADAYVHCAARFAVFGADCAGREPRLEQWMAVAREAFDAAIEAVKESKEIVRLKEQEEAPDLCDCDQTPVSECKGVSCQQHGRCCWQ